MIETRTPHTDRRPLTTRSTAVALRTARFLASAGASPNAISLAGVAFAGVGAAAMVLSPARPLLWLAAAAAIQLRLAANMVDGLVAIEGGRQSAIGPLFNEVPDRIEDSMLLVAAGYAGGWPMLGWLAALLACATAYVRTLSGALGFPQDFCGPQAKPHRMAALTLACVIAAAVPAGPVMPAVLAMITVGTALTVARRTVRLGRRLKGAAA